MRKDYDRLLEAAREAGGTVVRLRSGHYRVVGPAGMWVVGGSPSDRRAWLNTITGLRRIGLDVGWRR